MANPPKQTLIKKKKKWYTVVAPKEMNNVSIGETMAPDADALKGRVVEANMMTLTNDPKKQNIAAKFKVRDVKESIAETELISYYIVPAHVKRLTKRAREKAEDSFKCETKDGKTVVIKPLMLLRSKVQHGVLSALRNKAREELTKEAKARSFMELVSSVLDGDLQKGLKQTLRKVYPITAAEIRVVELA